MHTRPAFALLAAVVTACGSPSSPASQEPIPPVTDGCCAGAPATTIVNETPVTQTIFVRELAETRTLLAADDGTIEVSSVPASVSKLTLAPGASSPFDARWIAFDEAAPGMILDRYRLGETFRVTQDASGNTSLVAKENSRVLVARIPVACRAELRAPRFSFDPTTSLSQLELRAIDRTEDGCLALRFVGTDATPRLCAPQESLPFGIGARLSVQVREGRLVVEESTPRGTASIVTFENVKVTEGLGLASIPTGAWVYVRPDRSCLLEPSCDVGARLPVSVETEDGVKVDAAGKVPVSTKTGNDGSDVEVRVIGGSVATLRTGCGDDVTRMGTLSVMTVERRKLP